MSKETGGPAFPKLTQDARWKTFTSTEGMTLRQYAAIKLKVPNSGTDWLDSMISQSLRDGFAAKAMQATFGSPIEATKEGKEYIAMHAYKMADAMLKAREQ